MSRDRKTGACFLSDPLVIAVLNSSKLQRKEEGEGVRGRTSVDDVSKVPSRSDFDRLEHDSVKDRSDDGRDYRDVLGVVLESEGAVEEVVLDTTASGRFRNDALANWRRER